MNGTPRTRNGHQSPRGGPYGRVDRRAPGPESESSWNGFRFVSGSGSGSGSAPGSGSESESGRGSSSEGIRSFGSGREMTSERGSDERAVGSNGASSGVALRDPAARAGSSSDLVNGLVPDDLRESVPTRIAFLGLGHQGWRLVDGFRKLGYNRVASGLIDLDGDRARRVVPLRLPEFGDWMSGDDWAREWDRSRQRAVWQLERAWGGGVELAMICLGGGDRVAALGLPSLIDAARDATRGARVGVALFLPERARRGGEVESLLSVCRAVGGMSGGPVIVVDRERVRRLLRLPPETSGEKAIGMAAAHLFHLFHRAAGAEGAPGNLARRQWLRMLDCGVCSLGVQDLGRRVRLDALLGEWEARHEENLVADPEFGGPHSGAWVAMAGAQWAGADPRTIDELRAGLVRGIGRSRVWWHEPDWRWLTVPGDRLALATWLQGLPFPVNRVMELAADTGANVRAAIRAIHDVFLRA